MEHPFFPTTTTRAEALRWLAIAEKLLTSRDFIGSKSFATRARDSDPGLYPADQILAVVDTLIAGEARIGNNNQDLYGILRLAPPQGDDPEFMANQYRNLVVLLHPQKNRFPFADQAFRLVVEAWSVLSDPLRKSLYDKELAFYLHQQQQQQNQTYAFSNPLPTMQQNFMFLGSSVAPPQMHVVGGSTGGGQPSQFPQVNAGQPQVEALGGVSTRESQNFMAFNSGFVFGSGSKSSHEPVNKQVQESIFSGFVGGGDMGSASVANQNQVNNKEKQPQENYANPSDRASYNVNVNENVGDMREDEANEEQMDLRGEEGEEEDRDDEPVDETVNESTFWTACPYCYHMYEYPTIYNDCCLRCQNCKSAFQGVVIQSPPPIMDGQESYFCCWGFFPLGLSIENWEKYKGAACGWAPFSSMFTCPSEVKDTNNVKKKRGGWNSGPRIYIDDDEVYVEISNSDESDDDWQYDRHKRKKARNVKGKGTARTPNRSAKKTQVDMGKVVDVQDGVEMPNTSIGDLGKKGVMASARRQPGRVAKSFGKLDLNVELSNEAEESAPRVNPGVGPGRGEDDNIEGNGFFEGLDEFLSSLPILNVVGDDNVAKAS